MSDAETSGRDGDVGTASPGDNGRPCVRHGTATLLRCAQCDTPVCPKCTVWTVVGQKCPTCVGRVDPTLAQRARRLAGPILVGLGVILALLSLKFLASGGFQKKSPRPSSQVDTQPATIAIGERGTDEDLEFLVSRFECGATQVGSGPGARSAVGRFCLLDLKVRNRGNDPVQFTAMSQVLKDTAGRRYAFDARATLANLPSVSRDFLTFQQLNPGIEVQGVLVYDVPASVVPVVAELHRGLAAGGRLVGLPSRGVRVRLSPAI